MRGAPGQQCFLFECRSDDEWKVLRDNELGNHDLTGPYAVVVDALFGTGLARPLEGVHREAVRYLR